VTHEIGLCTFDERGRPVTIQDWGALGELIGAAAVVVTLIYLATQVRYARLAASDVSRQARAQGVLEMQLMTINNREFREAWRKAARGSEGAGQRRTELLGLPEEEALMVLHGCIAWTWLHWAQYRSIKTPEDEMELEHLVSTFYSLPPMATLWKDDPLLRGLLDPGFVAWVDRVLAEGLKPM
jgi:hypothetical protein